MNNNKESFLKTSRFNMLSGVLRNPKSKGLVSSKFNLFSNIFFEDKDILNYLPFLYLDNLDLGNSINSFDTDYDLRIFNSPLFIESYNNKFISNINFKEVIKLPIPDKIEINLINSLNQRKSLRCYKRKNMSIKLLSNLLFYSFKIKNNLSSDNNHYPSAGGLYPVDVYLYINNVENISEGFYLYDKLNNSLKIITNEKIDFEKLMIFNFKEERNCNFICFFVWNANFNYFKYGNNSLIFTSIEIGTMIQNLDLILTKFNLGMCHIGGFNREYIDEILTKKVFMSRTLATTIIGFNCEI